MKIAMIANQGGSGGYIAYIKGLLSEMTEHDVVFYCTEELKEKIKHICKNIKIHTTPYAKEKGMDIFLNKPLHEELICEVEKFNPDIVFFVAGWTRRGLEKYPNVMVLHNQLYVNDKILFKNVSKKTLLTMLGFRQSVRRSMKNADGVIFLSDKSKKDADKNKISYKSGQVIHFGMLQDSFNEPKKLSIDDSIVKLLYVSAFFEYKNHESLFKAISILKEKGYNLNLTLIGKGPNYREKTLKDLTQELNISENVEFCGWKGHEEVLSAIDNTDIYVYPSSIESTGLGVMEAMARGGCIASSDMSSMPEVLKDAGLYFNPKNPDEIALVIEKLITDKELRKNLSHKAYDYSKEYSWENSVKKHYDYFKTFIKD